MMYNNFLNFVFFNFSIALIHSIDLFGGPDAAHTSFTVLQKAINYAMTSFFTTGGIRGESEALEKYHPILTLKI